MSESLLRIPKLESWLGLPMVAEIRTAFWRKVKFPEFVKGKASMWLAMWEAKPITGGIRFCPRD